MGCTALGIGIGLAAKENGSGMDLMLGKPPHEAGIAALQEAEKLAGDGSWELLGVALSGDKVKAHSLIERAIGPKADGSDLQRVGQIYGDAGENEDGQGVRQAP
jgi:hypothetical protein